MADLFNDANEPLIRGAMHPLVPDRPLTPPMHHQLVNFGIARRAALLDLPAPAVVPSAVLRANIFQFATQQYLDFIEQNAERCSICLINFTALDEIRVLPCRHFFHNACLTHALVHDQRCPMCRDDLNQYLQLPVPNPLILDLFDDEDSERDEHEEAVPAADVQVLPERVDFPQDMRPVWIQDGVPPRNIDNIDRRRVVTELRDFRICKISYETPDKFCCCVIPHFTNEISDNEPELNIIKNCYVYKTDEVVRLPFTVVDEVSTWWAAAHNSCDTYQEDIFTERLKNLCSSLAIDAVTIRDTVYYAPLIAYEQFYTRQMQLVPSGRQAYVDKRKRVVLKRIEWVLWFITPLLTFIMATAMTELFMMLNQVLTSVTIDLVLRFLIFVGLDRGAAGTAHDYFRWFVWHSLLAPVLEEIIQRITFEAHNFTIGIYFRTNYLAVFGFSVAYLFYLIDFVPLSIALLVVVYKCFAATRDSWVWAMVMHVALSTAIFFLLGPINNLL